MNEGTHDFRLSGVCYECQGGRSGLCVGWGCAGVSQHGPRIGRIPFERPRWHLDAPFSRKSRDKVITEGCHLWNFPCQGYTCQAVVRSSAIKPGWTWVQSFTSTVTLGPDLCFVFLTCSVGLIQDLTSWGAVHLK